MEHENINGSLSLSNDLSVGGEAKVQGEATFEHDVKIKGWLDAPNIKGIIKGLYADETALKSNHPAPQPGWVAFVGNNLPADIWRAEKSAGRIVWTPTGKKGGELVIPEEMLNQFLGNGTYKGNLNITGNDTEDGKLDVQGKTTIHGGVLAEGDSGFRDNLDVDGKLNVINGIHCENDITIETDAQIDGGLKVGKDLNITGQIRCPEKNGTDTWPVEIYPSIRTDFVETENLGVTEAAVFSGTITVLGGERATHASEIRGGIVTENINAKSLNVEGNSIILGDLYVDGAIRSQYGAGALRGLFNTAEELLAAFPEPNSGDFAYVGSGFPAELYKVEASDNGNIWIATGTMVSDSTGDVRDIINALRDGLAVPGTFVFDATGEAVSLNFTTRYTDTEDKQTVVSIPLATSEASGMMSASDKQALDKLKEDCADIPNGLSENIQDIKIENTSVSGQSIPTIFGLKYGSKEYKQLCTLPEVNDNSAGVLPAEKYSQLNQLIDDKDRTSILFSDLDNAELLRTLLYQNRIGRFNVLSGSRNNILCGLLDCYLTQDGRVLTQILRSDFILNLYDGTLQSASSYGILYSYQRIYNFGFSADTLPDIGQWSAWENTSFWGNYGGIATPTTVPKLGEFYFANTAGSYTHFLSGGNPIQIEDGELALLYKISVNGNIITGKHTLTKTPTEYIRDVKVEVVSDGDYADSLFHLDVPPIEDASEFILDGEEYYSILWGQEEESNVGDAWYASNRVQDLDRGAEVGLRMDQSKLFCGAPSKFAIVYSKRGPITIYRGGESVSLSREGDLYKTLVWNITGFHDDTDRHIFGFIIAETDYDVSQIIFTDTLRTVLSAKDKNEHWGISYFPNATEYQSGLMTPDDKKQLTKVSETVSNLSSIFEITHYEESCDERNLILSCVSNNIGPFELIYSEKGISEGCHIKGYLCGMPGEITISGLNGEGNMNRIELYAKGNNIYIKVIPKEVEQPAWRLNIRCPYDSINRNGTLLTTVSTLTVEWDGISSGSQEQRPEPKRNTLGKIGITPKMGKEFYNRDTEKWEKWNGSSWNTIFFD